MSEFVQQMLFHEYTAIYTSLNNFWTKRVSILGVGSTLLVTLAGFAQKLDPQIKAIGDLAIPILLWGLVRMLGALTKGIFIFTFRMREIAEGFGVHGLWSVFPEFVKRHPSVSGTAPYYYICHVLNLGLGVSIIISNLTYLIDNFHTEVLFIRSGLVITLVIVIIYITFKEIRKNLAPEIFLDSLITDWNLVMKLNKKNKE